MRDLCFMKLCLILCVVWNAQGSTDWEPAEVYDHVLENKVLRVGFHTDSHTYYVQDHRTKRLWELATENGIYPVRAATLTDAHLQVEFEDTSSGRNYMAKVSISDSGMLNFQINAIDDAPEFRGLAYPPAPKSPLERGMVLFNDRAQGNYVPQNDEFYGGRVLTCYANTSALDMPWLGMVDVARGDGIMLLFNTPHEGSVYLRQDEDGLMWPQPHWFASMSKFSYPREISYVFTHEGGYTAQAKWFRAWIQEKGLFKKLADKKSERPRVDWLAGAVTVWGAPSAEFVAEARIAGIHRMMLNGRFTPEDMQQMKDWQYLVGEYDNYSDIAAGREGMDDSDIEAEAYRNPEGELLTGWVTLDGFTYFMRAASKARAAAERKIPPLLETYPYTARFLDVHSALHFFEDWHPERMHTRRDDMRFRQELYAYINELGLVTGGEHGKSWAVPYLDYVEGMMSGPFWWDTNVGHLVALESRDEITPEYTRYGISPKYRIPLWELVYHDALVSTWYWGDSNGFLYNVAPEISDRKDLMNVLYATPPLVWTNHLGFGWHRNRERLLETCYVTTRLHERLMYKEMLEHEFISDDRMLQRTRFDGNIYITANFDEKPRQVTLAKSDDKPISVLLAPNGFYVEADDIVAHRIWQDGGALTIIDVPEFYYIDNRTDITQSYGPFLEITGRLAAYIPNSDSRWTVRLSPESSTQLDMAALCPLEDAAVYRPVQLDESGRMREELYPSTHKIHLASTKAPVLFSVLNDLSESTPLFLPSSGPIRPDEEIRISVPNDMVEIYINYGEDLSITAAIKYDSPITLEAGQVLTAVSYLNDTIQSNPQSASYQVGYEAFRSEVKRGAEPATPVRFSIANMDQLSILITDADDGLDYDNAALGNARLVTADGTVTFLDIVPLLTSNMPFYHRYTDENATMFIAGEEFERGVITHSIAEFTIALNRAYQYFEADIGVPDQSQDGAAPDQKRGSVEFVFTVKSVP